MIKIQRRVLIDALHEAGLDEDRLCTSYGGGTRLVWRIRLDSASQGFLFILAIATLYSEDSESGPLFDEGLFALARRIADKVDLEGSGRHTYLYLNDVEIEG